MRGLVTCYYGQPDASLSGEAWRLLASFKPEDREWCVIGGFNEILSHDEKYGRRPRCERIMG